MLARSSSPKAWANGSWGPLAAAMGVACTCIMVRPASMTALIHEALNVLSGHQVRSFFRLIECAQGSHGFLTLHENYFMALDALPLAIAVGIFVLFWPERYLPEPRWDTQSAIPLNSITSDKERVAS
jgi:hypothetical protein